MDRQDQVRQQEALRTLHEVTTALVNESDMGKLLNLIMDGVTRFSRAERGFMVMMNSRGELDVKVARKLNKETIDDSRFKVSRGIIEECLNSAQPVVLQDAKKDSDFGDRQSIVRNKPVSVACIPMKLQGQVIGALYLDSRVRQGLFTPDMMMMLEMFAGTAAMAINNALLVMRARRADQQQAPPPPAQ